MDKFEVVIVGGGKAGSQTVASLRDEGFTGSILLIAAEPELPYDRPPLSKEFLTGQVARAELDLRAPGYYDQAATEVWLSCPATEIDTSAQVVRTPRGDVGYGDLVLATGAALRSLPLEGADASNVVGLKNLDDAERIRLMLSIATNVVIVGGGFIGLEIAAVAARHFGAKVTLLEAMPRLMARTGLPETASYVRDYYANELGVDIRLNTAVTGLGTDRAGRVIHVETADGTCLPADLVIYGIGVIPRTELAVGADIVVGNGIEVDEQMHTSAPHVWAIGDCASFPLHGTGVRIRLESVQNATDQARHVAAQIAGTEVGPYTAVPWFWSDQDALKIQSAGILHNDDRRVLVASEKGFSVLAFRAGVLVGGDSVNAQGDHLAIRRLLAAPLSAREVISPARAEVTGFDLKAAAKKASAARATVS